VSTAIDVRRLTEHDVALMRSLNAMFARAFADPQTYEIDPPGDAYLSAVLGKEHVVVLAAIVDGVIAGELVAFLRPSLEKPNILGYTPNVPRVVDVRGYAVRVFTDDHGPPHVHVWKDGVLLKISLDPVEIVSVKYGRASPGLRRTVLAIVRDHLPACWDKWIEIYGKET
jgi:hypothetical protein